MRHMCDLRVSYSFAHYYSQWSLPINDAFHFLIQIKKPAFGTLSNLNYEKEILQ